MNFSAHYLLVRRVLDLTPRVLAVTEIGEADQFGELTYL
jgi:hypothetical protein